MSLPLLIQAVFLALALALVVHYARQGLDAYLGPVLFHAGTAGLVVAAMVLGWWSVQALLLQGVFVVAPYVLVTGYRLGMERAMSNGDFVQAVTMARSRALLLPFRAHRRDAAVAAWLLEAARSDGPRPLDPASAGLRPEEARVARDALLLRTLSRQAREHDWQAIRAAAGPNSTRPPSPRR